MSGRRVPVRLPGDDGKDVTPLIGTFLRGLSLGALVGAALAGSALLQRRRGPRRERSHAGSGEDRDAIRP